MGMPAVLNAIGFGYGMVVNRDLEKSFSYDRTYKAVFQVLQGMDAAYYASTALKLAGTAVQLPLSAAMGFALVIFGVAVADYALKDTKLESLKKMVKYVHNNISEFSHIVALVSSIAIAVMGMPVFGVLSAAFIIYGYASRNNHISDKARKIVDLTVVGTMAVASVMTGNIIGLVGAAALFKIRGLDRMFTNDTPSQIVINLN